MQIHSESKEQGVPAVRMPGPADYESWTITTGHAKSLDIPPAEEFYWTPTRSRIGTTVEVAHRLQLDLWSEE